jgi:predicted transcriptional regulator
MFHRINMSLLDDRVYEEIAKSPTDLPIRFMKLAKAVGCHKNTIYAATKRLENAGRIRRKRERRGQPLRFEVLDD